MTEQATDNVLDFAAMIHEDCLFIMTAVMGLEGFAEKAPFGPQSKGAQAVLLAARMLKETSKILQSAVEAPAVEPEEKGNGDNVAVVPVQCTDKDNEQGQPGAQGDEV